MKKIVIGIIIFVALGLSYVLLNYGWLSPIKNIAGCYATFLNKERAPARDIICLHDSGQYEQIFRVAGHPEKQYNQASWKSFSYTVGDQQHAAGTLNTFIIIDDQGVEISTLELDIQVDKKMSGNASFVIGNQHAGKRRVYVREKM